METVTKERVPDQYKKPYIGKEELEEFQRDKFAVLLLTRKERLEKYKMKILVNYYFQVVNRQFVVLAVGSSERWKRCMVTVSLEQYNRELDKEIIMLCGPVKKDGSGPSLNLKNQLTEILAKDVKKLRAYLRVVELDETDKKLQNRALAYVTGEGLLYQGEGWFVKGNE